MLITIILNRVLGPISQMMIQSGLQQYLSKDPPSSPAPVVKVFKKHMQKSSSEDSEKMSSSFPIQVHGVDPVCCVLLYVDATCLFIVVCCCC